MYYKNWVADLNVVLLDLKGQFAPQKYNFFPQTHIMLVC